MTPEIFAAVLEWLRNHKIDGRFLSEYEIHLAIKFIADTAKAMRLESEM